MPRKRQRPRLGGVVERRATPVFERSTHDARRPVEDLDHAILDAIANGPLMKWELRDLLHEPEAAIYKRLRAMRDEGLVKVVGKTLIRRRWALRAWQDPAKGVRPPRADDETTIVVERKAPTDSWWTKHAAPDARDEFIGAAKARDAELRHSNIWRSPSRPIKPQA